VTDGQTDGQTLRWQRRASLRSAAKRNNMATNCIHSKIKLRYIYSPKKTLFASVYKVNKVLNCIILKQEAQQLLGWHAERETQLQRGPNLGEGDSAPVPPFHGGRGSEPNIICLPQGATRLPIFISMRSTVLPEFTFVSNLGGPVPPFPPSVGGTGFRT